MQIQKKNTVKHSYEATSSAIATADLTERRFVLQFPAPVGIMFESLRA